MRFWTGHSARHTLPTWAAACGFPKEQRDFLGRWAFAKHGSNDYVVTSRQVAHNIQLEVAKTIIVGGPAMAVTPEVLAELDDIMFLSQGSEIGNLKSGDPRDEIHGVGPPAAEQIHKSPHEDVGGALHEVGS